MCFHRAETINMLMALVKQSHHLIAISLQFPLYKQKIEDLVTIEIHFLSSSMDLLFILIQLEVLVQLKKNYASRFHNPIFQF